jgi:hypothetical protein
MSDLKKAADAWDRAEREGRLNPPAGPDTQPRNSITNRPVPINIKGTWGHGTLHSPFRKS